MTTPELHATNGSGLGLSGKVAVVTGALGLLGRQHCQALARAGAHVVATDLDPAALAALALELGEHGRGALGVAADVTLADSLDALRDAVLGRYDRIDILVNNAGIARDQQKMRMKRADWDAVIAISSVVGQMGNAGQANYAASKAGLIGFCKSMAREVASRGITVNVVAPGLIETDMTKALTGTSREDWAERIPLGRLGSPEDVAHAVCFLASDEASYITGHVLAVNGGMYT